MQRSRFRLPQQVWGTTASKYPANDAHVGPDDFTNGTKNMETETVGALQKRLGDSNYEASPSTGTIKDMYEAVFVDGTHHLLRVRSGTLEYSPGSGTFSTVTSGYSSIGNFEFAQYADRTYFGNGIDNPQVYDKVSSYGGVSYTAPKTKQMGAQAPGSALTAAVGAAGSVPAGTYSYKVTYLYYDFEESNGGTASGTVSPGVASQINLTSIPVGGYGVTARKIYRSNNSGLSYTLVTTINDNTTTSFTDNVATPTSTIPVDNGGPRNFTLIVQHNDRLWVGGIPGDKSDLDYSAAGLPDIWPSTNTLICNPRDPMTGLVVYNDRVVVFNKFSFGQILGTSPDNYRYSAVPGDVGCVDQRTIQVRVIHGVPILVWLSDKGFYGYNGSTVEYLSDSIEDLINFNIQQALQSSGSNSQSSQADFNSGFKTSGGGIDLTSNPGAITTPNPKFLVDEKSEWEAGSSISNIATASSSSPNTLSQATKGTFLRTGGALSGAVLSSGNIQLPVASNWTGESKAGTSGFANTQYSTVAYPIVIPRGGVITTFTIPGSPLVLVSPVPGSIKIWSDSFGQPGSVLYSAAVTYFSGTTSQTATPNLTVAAGTYWIGVELTSTFFTFITLPTASFSGGSLKAKLFSGGSWVVPSLTTTFGASTTSYVFSQTAVSSSGTWISDVQDTTLFSQASSISVVLNHTATYASGTSASSYVDESDDILFTTGVVSSTAQASLNGSSAAIVLASTKRYFRVRIQLSATDDRSTPSITSDPTITYPATVTWVSATADNTLDVSSMNNVVAVVSSLPSGTTATITVQKATVSTGPFTDDFTSSLALGTNTLSLSGMTHPTQRYSRIKVVLNNTTTPTASAFLSSVKLTWTITAKFYSQVIDTGITPAGWDVFQTSVTASGAGVTFGMRSDAVSANLSDDVPAGPFVPAFTTVTNGNFPTGVTVARFAQWTASLVATEDSVPIIDSVTINWFITQTNSIRPASLFFFRNYYVSLARYNSTVNDVIVVLDQEGNWRVWDGQHVGTFSLFFGEPYFGDASSAIVRKFLSGNTDHGNAITLDVRFKAFDFDDITKIKVLRQVFLTVANTGATYTVDYSLDRGTTWNSLVDYNGSTSFTVSSDNALTTKRLVPSTTGKIGGQTILVRVQEATTNSARIHELQIDAIVRQGEIING
jgi:hypothetical protein